MPPMDPRTRAVAFVATSRPLEAARFYRDTLGLTLVEDSPFALVFDAFGTPLRVQKAAVVTPVPYTCFGLEVPDIERAVDHLAAAGIEAVRYEHFAQDARGIWSAPGGGRVFWFRDPDGNLLSLSQPPQA
jgi:catechol 2,3-dioxygenase-like lactoylglutathione lyase family enzyme